MSWQQMAAKWQQMAAYWQLKGSALAADGVARGRKWHRIGSEMATNGSRFLDGRIRMESVTLRVRQPQRSGRNG
jgi:hypothetical protein